MEHLNPLFERNHKMSLEYTLAKLQRNKERKQIFVMSQFNS